MTKRTKLVMDETRFFQETVDLAKKRSMRRCARCNRFQPLEALDETSQVCLECRTRMLENENRWQQYTEKKSTDIEVSRLELKGYGKMRASVSIKIFGLIIHGFKVMKGGINGYWVSWPATKTKYSDRYIKIVDAESVLKETIEKAILSKFQRALAMPR